MAASHHGDTPYSGNSVTSVPVTPYTTSVDVNRPGPLACCRRVQLDERGTLAVVSHPGHEFLGLPPALAVSWLPVCRRL